MFIKIASRERQPERLPAGPPAGFRPDIQALRALAVTAVVLFHLRPGLVPGGFVGVDVFFVISGYLITAHLLREHEVSGSIRLGTFYARRVQRLLPAAVLVLGASTVLCLALLPASVREQNYREIIASLLYAQNWSLAIDSVDYLRSASDPSLVQHFWTLSLEEQFYFAWPWVLLAAGFFVRRRSVPARRRTMSVLMVVTAGLSFAFAVYYTALSPAAAYFITPTRLWEFAIGGFLAVRSLDLRARVLPSRWSDVVAWVGVAAIILASLLFSGETPYPGIAALVPTLGTAMIIVAAGGRGRLSPMLIGRWRPVQYLGDISYSLYLWHWPLIVVYPIATGHPPGAVGSLLILGTAIVLAAATRHLVEVPFQRVTGCGRRLVLVAVAASMAAVLAFGVVQIGQIRAESARTAEALAQVADGDCFGARSLAHPACASPTSANAPFDAAFAAADYGDATIDACGSGRVLAPVGDAFECEFGDEQADFVLVLLGDSHAGHWLPALQVLAEDRGWKIVSLLRSSCPVTAVTPTIDGLYQDGCEDWKVKALDHVAQLSPDLVITSSLTPFGYQFGGGDLGPEASLPDSYTQMVTRLAALAPVVAIKDTPYMEVDIPGCLSAAAGSTECDRPRAAVLDDHVDPLWESASALAHGIDLNDVLCGDDCYSVIGGVVVYRDRQHLSATFARTLADPLLAALQGTGLPIP